MTVLIGIRPAPRSTIKERMSKWNIDKGETIISSEKEAKYFIYNFPGHTALKLQTDNYIWRVN